MTHTELLLLIQPYLPYAMWAAIGLAGYVVFALLLWYTTWIFYCAAMCFWWAGAQIKGDTVRWTKLTGRIAGWLNVTLNYAVISVLFLELPRRKEPNVSARMLRHYRHGPDGWRKRLAGHIGRVWLDPLDPTGKHI